ncbi:MAG: hypothetical protein QM751_13665 [Paludibacteraceae bacterium]
MRIFHYFSAVLKTSRKKHEKNRMRNDRFIWILLFLPMLFGCHRERDRAYFERLFLLDSISRTAPEKMMDSLKLFDRKELSRYNYGYYLLLDVISKDKTYFNFTSDSLIKLSAKLLTGKKNEYPINYARSLMYRGIVRYRMGITDSTAYEPIKEAADFLEKKKISDSYLLFFCYNYLGLIHSDNDNLQQGISYLQRAAQKAKLYGDKDYLFNTYRELAWAYLIEEQLNKAKQYIDTLAGFNVLSPAQQSDTDYLLSSYYEYNKEPLKALEINFQLLNDEKIRNENLSKTLRSIAKNYKDLNKPDNALYYAEKAEECKQDSNYYLNYFYYTTIGEIAERLKLWQKSAQAYKKAYFLRDKAVSKDLDKHILELEKKYDYTEAEYKVLKYRNRLIITAFTGVILLLLLIVVIVVFRHRGKQTLMKSQLAEQKK